MNTKSDLKAFYDQEAEKYAYTRKKHRPESDLILAEISNTEKKTIKILELGCGGGRLLSQLNRIKNKKIVYTGVDLSENLINIANKDFLKQENCNIKAEFICEDMTHYIDKPKQETFDLIICIASFQHIPSYKERLFLTKSFYRILSYEGKVLMTNRSFSRRFIKKYYKNIIDGFIRNLLKYGLLNIKDIEIPRKSKGETHKRYYHIFTIKELRNICKLSGFTEKKLCYLDNKGKESNNIKDAKNSRIVMDKNI